AGCRSDNLEMPEEQNRIVTDHLSRLLLAPSQMAVENLHREGIGTKDDPLQRTITMVGDVMYDALLHDLPLTEVTADETLRDFGLEKQGYYLLTVHRAKITDGSSPGILRDARAREAFPENSHRLRWGSKRGLLPEGAMRDAARPDGVARNCLVADQLHSRDQP